MLQKSDWRDGLEPSHAEIDPVRLPGGGGARAATGRLWPWSLGGNTEGRRAGVRPAQRRRARASSHTLHLPSAAQSWAGGFKD